MAGTDKINANASGNEEAEQRARQIEDAIRKADRAKTDAEERERASGETLDKCLAALDSISKRMDEWEAADKAKADEEAAAREPSDPLPLAADSLSEPYRGAPVQLKDNTLCDSYGDPHPCARNAKVDASIRVDSMIRANTDNAWRAEVHRVQARADQITSLWGAKTPAVPLRRSAT
jgi:hypothetical protein